MAKKNGLRGLLKPDGDRVALYLLFLLVLIAIVIPIAVGYVTIFDFLFK